MRIIINGGGIIGLTAAILLQKNNHDVVLIEKSNNLGGLLNSLELFEGLSFDFGTHIPRETGINELDEVLFGNLNKSEWNTFDYANVGNYFNGHLNKDSQFIDAGRLESIDYVEGLKDIFSEIETENAIKNCEEFLFSHFGKKFATSIYFPLVKKLFGVNDIEKLSPIAPLLFGYSRMIIGDEHFTNRLKTIGALDSRIAFNKNAIGSSSLKSYYPMQSGIYQWVDYLTKEARQSGVDIRMNSTIEQIDQQSKELIVAGKKMKYDLILWTVLETELNKLLGISVEEQPKEFVGVNLYHFKYQGDLLTNNQYVYCNDSKLKTFRITLYDNSTAKISNICTVEVLGENYGESEKEIFDELITMGILSNDASILESKHLYLAKGFPIPYIIQNEQEMIDHDKIIVIKKDASNFFMEDLLKKLYNKLESNHLLEMGGSE